MTTTKSDTPECDGHEWRGHCGDQDWQMVVGSHFARRLERERDEARQMAARLVVHLESVMQGNKFFGAIQKSLDAYDAMMK